MIHVLRPVVTYQSLHSSTCLGLCIRLKIFEALEYFRLRSDEVYEALPAAVVQGKEVAALSYGCCLHGTAQITVEELRHIRYSTPFGLERLCRL